MDSASSELLHPRRQQPDSMYKRWASTQTADIDTGSIPVGGTINFPIETTTYGALSGRLGHKWDMSSSWQGRISRPILAQLAWISGLTKPGFGLSTYPPNWECRLTSRCASVSASWRIASIEVVPTETCPYQMLTPSRPGSVPTAQSRIAPEIVDAKKVATSSRP